jgi:hypothetical protein
MVVHSICPDSICESTIHDSVFECNSSYSHRISWIFTFMVLFIIHPQIPCWIRQAHSPILSSRCPAIQMATGPLPIPSPRATNTSKDPVWCEAVHNLSGHLGPLCISRKILFDCWSCIALPNILCCDELSRLLLKIAEIGRQRKESYHIEGRQL